MVDSEFLVIFFQRIKNLKNEVNYNFIIFNVNKFIIKQIKFEIDNNSIADNQIAESYNVTNVCTIRSL